MDTLQTIFALIWIDGLQLSHKKCLEALIRAMFVTLSVNLSRLASAMFSGARQSSTIRRIERLLALNIFPVALIGKAILKVLPPQKRYILTMDRTTWELGTRIYNILVVGICFDGISIPIYFRIFDKRGATKFTEQISFMECVLDIIRPEQIACLVADREFGYYNFVRWLETMEIPYCLRIRETSYVQNASTGKSRMLRHILSSLSTGRSVVLSGSYKFGRNMKVRIYAMRRKEHGEDSLLILATPEKSSFTDKIYRLRWQIETAFRAMKTAGFNIERSHLKATGRFKNMLAVVLIAYACAFIEGLIKSRRYVIPTMKSNGRKRFSIFTWGLKFIIDDIWKEDASPGHCGCKPGP